MTVAHAPLDPTAAAAPALPPVHLTPRSGRALQAFRHARRTFVAGQRVDVGDIATAFDVDPATVFRWLGNRNRLLEEVIWSLCCQAWQDQLDLDLGHGAERVTAVVSRWARACAEPEFFRAYLHRESARALRLLTTRDGGHQGRVIRLVEALLVEEVHGEEAAGRGLDLPMPAHDLAYVMCRIAEGFVYSDLITGAEPDLDQVEPAIGALLGLRYRA